VIWNGVDGVEDGSDRLFERAQLGALENDVLFILVGRINWWKGQSLLVEAFSYVVASTGTRARLAIIGSAPPGQEHYEHELAEVVAKSGCSDRIVIVPYRVDINTVWNAADVVVIPSTEPEPFGRVAIEAMAFAKPVIAAAHGGLLEIIDHGVTGLLVTPRDSLALSLAMKTLLSDEVLRKSMGDAGLLRQRAQFSVAGYALQLRVALESALIPHRLLGNENN
jgi:glycosyltransferase involved in cell wall biosynthesis